MKTFIFYLGIALLFIFVAAERNAPQAQQLPFFSPYPHLDRTRWHPSSGWANGDWQSCEWRADDLSGVDGNLQLRLSDKGGKLRRYDCAEIHSAARMKYGRYAARLRAAAGSGLNTAFFTYIGPPVGVPSHEEIDFEFLGKNTHAVEITYWKYGKKYDHVVIPLKYDASAAFHNYAFEWTPTAIRWYVDGRQVHETPAKAPIPEKAARIYLSLWSGSAVENSWMGPFVYQKPVTAEVAWVKYTPLKVKP